MLRGPLHERECERGRSADRQRFRREHRRSAALARLVFVIAVVGAAVVARANVVGAPVAAHRLIVGATVVRRLIVGAAIAARRLVDSAVVASPWGKHSVEGNANIGAIGPKADVAPRHRRAAARHVRLYERGKLLAGHGMAGLSDRGRPVDPVHQSRDGVCPYLSASGEVARPVLSALRARSYVQERVGHAKSKRTRDGGGWGQRMQAIVLKVARSEVMRAASFDVPRKVPSAILKSPQNLHPS